MVKSDGFFAMMFHKIFSKILCRTLYSCKWSGKMGSGLVSRPLDDLCSCYLDFWWVCVMWWVCSGSGSVNSVSMSFQKMFGLYGLKHQVEIFLMRDGRPREDRATYLLIWNTLRLAMVLFIHLVQNWKCQQVSLVCSSSSCQIVLPSLMTWHLLLNCRCLGLQVLQ